MTCAFVITNIAKGEDVDVDTYQAQRLSLVPGSVEEGD